ncbi:MAG: ABC-type sugar transport system, permease component [Microbacterium sp.]|nr:ABC-type sugar transport system, permease component [Microbacterium sp.]
MTLTSPAAPAAVVEAPQPPRRRREKRVTPGRALTYTVLVVGLIVWVLPFAWMLLGSVKTQREILQRPPTWWPQEFTWDNFGAWFGQLNFGQFFGNSILVALFTVAGNLVFCSMVGYALAKMDFPGKKALFLVVMVTLMVPGVVTFVPLFVMVSSLGLVDSYAALILPFVTTPLGVFLMRQFMLGIPDPLLEAARIDGAGELRIFARIVMPLCGPPLATLGILTFLPAFRLPAALLHPGHRLHRPEVR